MRSQFIVSSALASALLTGLMSFEPSAAHACGGFFCSQTQPVNQAAERIIFANNGDGTVTAVIQIMYEGPAESFSWLLPISTVPAEGDLAVASDIAFQRLQQATNPQYSLITRVEGRCGSDGERAVTVSADSSGATATPSFGRPDDGVSVAASGVVGNFDWVTLALDPQLPEPADAAVGWLTANGYDVPPSSAGLLGPYLNEQGMYLLALKLTKGSSVGSIRPIVLTYDGQLPSIPIKLTAVAANDDMGVMAWVSGPSRAVPFNYLGLELNEARINWFNPASNYAEVVTAAADDAGGQGFVTEFAGASQTLNNIIWTPSDEADWQAFSARVYSNFRQIFDTSLSLYGDWDGFWDAVEASVTLPAGVSFEDFRLCPNCQGTPLQFSPSAYIAALKADVIDPVQAVQALIGRQPYLTRLYSTLSAGDMTVDPVFAVNPDLPDLSNVHTAERIIECHDGVEEFEATWRIELPQGGVLRGTADDVGIWPTAMASQPPNFRVLELSASGPGAVVDDFSDNIESGLDDYNATVPRAEGSGGFCNLGPRGGGATPTSALAALFALLFSRRLSQRRPPRAARR